MTKVQIKDFLVNRTIDEMTKYLVEDYKLDIASAIDIIYNSDTLRKLEDTDNGLYIQSPAYVYELLDKEYREGRIC